MLLGKKFEQEDKTVVVHIHDILLTYCIWLNYTNNVLDRRRHIVAPRNHLGPITTVAKK